MSIPGRAQSGMDKADVLTRLLKVWLAKPELRLGQLIINVVADPYYAEDEFLIREIELYYQEEP